MQVTETRWLKSLKPEDKVYATFEHADASIESIEGKVTKIGEDYIRVKDDSGEKSFSMWQMLSLVCPDKDLSFIREKSAVSDLDRLAMLLQ